MATDEIRNRIDSYFQFYQELATNLKSLSPTHPIEARLLALCYLDALSASARRHGIDNVISQFSQWKKLPALVSLGRLYDFLSWLRKLPEPTRKNKFLSKDLENEFWGTDAKNIKKAVKDLRTVHVRCQWKLLANGLRELTRKRFGMSNIKELVADLWAITPSGQWRLLMTALEEFARRRLKEAEREENLFVRARNVDLPPNDLARRFSQYISTGPDDFLGAYAEGYRSKKERFGVLIETKETGQIQSFFDFFTFSNVFRRNYRNPMVHKTVVPSQGDDWAETVNEPYYWFKPAGVHELVVDNVIPFRFFEETFVECLNNYEKFCRDGNRDPIPRVSQI